MIWKLLRKNVSVGQIAGYALANLVGLAIVLSAIRFYGDVSAALGDDDGDNPLISEDYLVISKPVSALNTLTGASTEFDPDDISDLRSQPWVQDVGAFQSAEFSVGAAVNVGGNGLSTFMFLESIPDEFIDIRPEQWRFDPTQTATPEVPIIISKDYLALYNFGFASSRGLPQLSEGLISKVPIKLYVNGNGLSDVYPARIVGFSSRLNTIAVPQTFMTWANERYAPGKATNPSRLILKVNKPGDPAIEEYMSSNNYEVAGDKMGNDRMSYFLTVLTSIVIAIGATISVLALFILVLSILLLIQKNRDKITNLMLLGYTPMQVSRGYYRLIGVVNAGVLVTAVIVMLVCSTLWQSRLASLSLTTSSPWTAILWGVVIMAVVTAMNVATIYHMVHKQFRPQI